MNVNVGHGSGLADPDADTDLDNEYEPDGGADDGDDDGDPDSVGGVYGCRMTSNEHDHAWPKLSVVDG